MFFFQYMKSVTIKNRVLVQKVIVISAGQDILCLLWNLKIYCTIAIKSYQSNFPPPRELQHRPSYFYFREICFNGIPLLPRPKCLKWFLCFRFSDYDIPISCVLATCSASLLYRPKSNIHEALQFSSSSFSLRPYLLRSKFLSTQN